MKASKNTSSSINSIYRKIILALLIFLFAFILRLWNLNDMGRVWDEQFVAAGGYNFVELAKKFDFGNDLWWKQDPDHPVLVRYIRGIASEFEIIGKEGGYPIFAYDLTYNRLISVFLTSLTAVLVALFGFRYISTFVGFAAGIILSMLPILLGHSQIAVYEPFDIFFFTAATFSFFIFLENQSKKRLILCGILFGLSIASRETGILLPPLFFLISIVHYFKNAKKLSFKKTLSKIVLICSIGVGVYFAIWPMMLFHLGFMAEYTYTRRLKETLSIPEVFFGRLLLTPIYYYAVYFFITTPALILALFLVGLKKIDTQKNWILYAVIIWFLIPFIQSFYHNRQHGVRYIIQMYPPLALIAAIGFNYVADFFTTDTKKKTLLFVPVVLYLLAILIKITPYYLDYFNEIVGGTNNVYEKRLFQMGWWGQGVKEAGLYVAKHAKAGSTVGIALDPPHVLPPLNNLKVSTYDPKKQYDYVIVNYYIVIRDGFDEGEVFSKYKLIHSVMADKARLVNIFQKK